MKTRDTKTKTPPAAAPKKEVAGKLNQATAVEFEREGLGVAPKE